jgi:hypothetical protein
MAEFSVQSRLFWLLVLVGHAVAAAGWLVLMPRGFPVTHPRFWANVVIPLLLIAAMTAALVAARRGRPVVVRAVLVALAGMWAAAAVSALVAFPVSIQWRLAVPLGMAVAVSVAANASYLRPARLRRAVAALAALSGMLLGAALPWTQRAPDPSTYPLNEPLPRPARVTSIDDAQPQQPRTRRTGAALVQPNDGQLSISYGRYVLYVQPLLTFVSRSPDRCWTSLARRAHRVGPGRRLLATSDDGRMHYEDDGRSALLVTGDDSGAAVVAHAELPHPVYSHLNAFCEMQMAGHRKLAVSFSPCPDVSVDVLPSDYPVGRPARLAFLGGDGVFRVVEASSGEKGPFHELARGVLERGDALTITFHDDGRPFCTVTLDDFARQASTDLSPTAGWGLPMNAIEFSLAGERDSSPASVFITLAGTGVGRGWDSVGHRAGTYRNRMRVEFMAPATKATTATHGRVSSRAQRGISGSNGATVLRDPRSARNDMAGASLSTNWKQ